MVIVRWRGKMGCGRQSGPATGIGSWIMAVLALWGGALSPDTARSATAIKLPRPQLRGQHSLEELLQHRRSVRELAETSLTVEEISQLLWAAQGITDSGGFRTAPSAGALYPLEVYVVAATVKGVEAGVYRYLPRTHELVQKKGGDKRKELVEAALGQPSVEEAPATLAFSAVYERTMGRYGERGVRYAHIEVGHAAQNVFLQAGALGLRTVVIGAFDDDGVKSVVGMRDGEQPLYIMPVGRR
jgi:SagB-type dehydrogenase family enzyme